MGVELLFEEVGAAFRIADVFGGVAASVQLQGYGAALKRSLEVLNALAVGMIETLGNAQDGRKSANDSLVRVV